MESLSLEMDTNPTGGLDLTSLLPEISDNLTSSTLAPLNGDNTPSDNSDVDSDKSNTGDKGFEILGKRTRSHPIKFSSEFSPTNLRKRTPAGKVQNPAKKVKVKPVIYARKRGTRCGKCSGCLRSDCGKCAYCRDKPKFGGPGKKKQRCALRTCSDFEHRGSGSHYYALKKKGEVQDKTDSASVIKNQGTPENETPISIATTVPASTSQTSVKDKTIVSSATTMPLCTTQTLETNKTPVSPTVTISSGTTQTSVKIPSTDTSEDKPSGATMFTSKIHTSMKVPAATPTKDDSSLKHLVNVKQVLASNQLSYAKVAMQLANTRQMISQQLKSALKSAEKPTLKSAQRSSQRPNLDSIIKDLPISSKTASSLTTKLTSASPAIDVNPTTPITQKIPSSQGIKPASAIVAKSTTPITHSYLATKPASPTSVIKLTVPKQTSPASFDKPTIKPVTAKKISTSAKKLPTGTGETASLSELKLLSEKSTGSNKLSSEKLTGSNKLSSEKSTISNKLSSEKSTGSNKTTTSKPTSAATVKTSSMKGPVTGGKPAVYSQSSPCTTTATSKVPTTTTRFYREKSAPKTSTSASKASFPEPKGSKDSISMVCVQCGRERNLGVARTSKFCTQRCVISWLEANPGRAPKDAVDVVGNISMESTHPTTSKQHSSSSKSLPRALKNLQIDMAQPGTKLSQSSASESETETELQQSTSTVEALKSESPPTTIDTLATMISDQQQFLQSTTSLSNPSSKISTSPSSSVASSIASKTSEQTKPVKSSILGTKTQGKSNTKRATNTAQPSSVKKTRMSSAKTSVQGSQKSVTFNLDSTESVIPDVLPSVPATIPFPLDKIASYLQQPKKSFDATKIKLPPGLPSDIRQWTVAQVVEYFSSTADCQSYVDLFETQEVDGTALLLLTHETLVKCLGIKLGRAVKIMNRVQELKNYHDHHQPNRSSHAYPF